MKRSGEQGFTLIEVLITATILGIIAAAILPLLSTCLQTHAQGVARAQLYRQGLVAMERMTGGVKRCTYLLIPNNHTPVRNTLAFSGFLNTDDDYYFGDPLFPRYDENLPSDMDLDDDPGIGGIDDDGNGLIDDGADARDDDEDGLIDEEILNGIDDDGDGNIDEDLGGDLNRDGAPGIRDVDDDGDGMVDEGAPEDDDEDGNPNEAGTTPVVYTLDTGSSTLRESIPRLGQTNDLATNVTSFQVTYAAPERIQIALTLTAPDGETISFVEYVYPRNTLQKTGKRVR